jgi:hypothetical protein
LVKSKTSGLGTTPKCQIIGISKLGDVKLKDFAV